MIRQHRQHPPGKDSPPGRSRFSRLFPVMLLCLTGLMTARDTLQVLLLPIESPRTLYGRFLPLKRYLEHSTGAALKLSIPRSMEEISRKFEQGQVDVAFLCPVLYCRLRARFPVEPLVTLRREGETTTTSVVVVREDSPMQVLADLKEHTFAYGKYQCAASGLVPRVMLQSAGFLPGDFLEVARLGSDESALYAVLARLYDATAVSRRAARAYLSRGLRMIRESFPIPNNLIAVHAHLAPEMRLRLRQAFLELDTLRHRDILKPLGESIDGFVAVQDSDYHTVRLLLRSGASDEEALPEAASGLRVGLPPFFTPAALLRQFDPLLRRWSRRMTMPLFPIIAESPE
ncbi:MAG: phosphate/phosphite/phosphonate ABC transporter substrate-binding protein, partial [Calditrichaeota bacterium]